MNHKPMALSVLSVMSLVVGCSSSATGDETAGSGAAAVTPMCWMKSPQTDPRLRTHATCVVTGYTRVNNQAAVVIAPDLCAAEGQMYPEAQTATTANMTSALQACDEKYRSVPACAMTVTDVDSCYRVLRFYPSTYKWTYGYNIRYENGCVPVKHADGDWDTEDACKAARATRCAVTPRARGC